MDKLTNYRNLIKRLLSELEALCNRQPRSGLDTVCIFDDVRDHYLLVNVGWSGKRHHFGATLYLRLRNGKIWIEEDWTEYGIATDLLAAGVPKEDIVLAFHHPDMRPLTEFAVA
jgi:hypothetical protein